MTKKSRYDPEQCRVMLGLEGKPWEVLGSSQIQLLRTNAPVSSLTPVLPSGPHPFSSTSKQSQNVAISHHLCLSYPIQATKLKTFQ